MSFSELSSTKTPGCTEMSVGVNDLDPSDNETELVKDAELGTLLSNYLAVSPRLTWQ